MHELVIRGGTLVDGTGDDARPGTPGSGENICPECRGSGRLGSRPCPTCGGTGKIVEGINDG